MKIKRQSGEEILQQVVKSRKVISIIVAFPNRKSFFFDNKLEFSGIKLAES